MTYRCPHQRRASRAAPGTRALLAFLLALLLGCAGDRSEQTGRELLAQYQCGSCHRIPGVRAARGNYGPTLEDFGHRRYIAGEIPNTPAALEAWIRNPSALVPGTLMPAMGVSQADARAMASYLQSLR
jgi:cytochrome c2